MLKIKLVECPRDALQDTAVNGYPSLIRNTPCSPAREKDKSPGRGSLKFQAFCILK